MGKLKVFMVMPFSDEIANSNYEHSIKPICDKHDLEVRRADELFTTGAIYEDIVKEIQDASIVIVDITNKNPNVFYELGMSHTLKRSRTIMVTQNNFKDTPFDIAHFRTIAYENSIVGKVKFEEKLTSTLANLLSDTKETFKDEFQLIFNILSSSAKYSRQLYSLLGIKKYKGILTSDSDLHVEGIIPDEVPSFSVWDSIQNAFQPMEKLGYVSYENNIIKLTEKGKAFVDFLTEKGVDCFLVNDQIFVENYVSIMERRMNKQHS